MKQTKIQHLQFALELLLFMAAPIARTSITPIYLGMLYVLFYFCTEVIGWMYIKSQRENVQNIKLYILAGFGLLTLGYGLIIRSGLVIGTSIGLAVLYALIRKYI